MKKSLFCITLLLASVTACKEESPEIPGYYNTRTSLQTDTINASGILLDIGDTTMTEEIEELELHTPDWEDTPMDADL